MFCKTFFNEDRKSFICVRERYAGQFSEKEFIVTIDIQDPDDLNKYSRKEFSISTKSIMDLIPILQDAIKEVVK